MQLGYSVTQAKSRLVFQVYQKYKNNKQNVQEYQRHGATDSVRRAIVASSLD
jgi:outer membrane protease